MLTYDHIRSAPDRRLFRAVLVSDNPNGVLPRPESYKEHLLHYLPEGVDSLNNLANSGTRYRKNLTFSTSHYMDNGKFRT